MGDDGQGGSERSVSRIAFVEKTPHQTAETVSLPSYARVHYERLYVRQCRTRVDPGVVGCGLFADERIESRRPIAEFKGERISLSESDAREAAYGSRGWQQEFMLRIDLSDVVIYPTVYGNHSRYTSD